MKFSIVVPIYKVEDYLRECVDSVLSQTYVDYELILVDDGSPDRCPIICDELSLLDSRIKVIHQNNSGVAVARNNGFKSAQGEYILCLDGDDLFADKSFLSELSTVCVEGVDVVQFGYKRFYDSENRIVDGEIPNHASHIDLSSMLKSVLLSDSYCGSSWSKAVRRGLISENDLYFRPGMVAGEDIDWFLRVLCCGKTFSCVNTGAVLYRQRAESVSHRPKIRSLENIVWLIEFWKNEFETRYKNEKVYDSLMGILSYYYANALILYTYFSYRESKPFRKRLKSVATLVKHALTPRARMIGKVYSLGGFDITILMLKIYRTLR